MTYISPSLKDFAFPFFFNFPLIRKCEKSLDNNLKNEECHNVKYEMINNFFECLNIWSRHTCDTLAVLIKLIRIIN